VGRRAFAVIRVAVGIAAWAWLACATAREAPVVNTSSTVLPRLEAGGSLESALAALNARGLRIVYSSALVKPAMTLRTSPKASRIEALLEEILAPWNLRAVPASNGDWLIVEAPRVEPSTSQDSLAPSEPEPLQTVDVTTSRYALATPGSSTLFLDREGVEQIPHLADDAVRMLKVMPGVSGGDFSAALNIRGGRREETLLRIDGAEIHNGFHFRDLDGALSVLDTNLVDSIDFSTGGMTAKYGDYMSGVVEMRTRRPREDDEYRHAAGVSFVSAYGRSSGTFAGGRGGWLASVRRGYLDVIMERVQDDDEQITPRYTDVFASLFYDAGDRTSLSAHVLLGEDDLKLISFDEDDIDSAGDGRAAHFWVSLDHAFENLQSRTVLSTSSVQQTRDSSGSDEQRTGDVFADFDFRFLDLRSEWSWQTAERHVVEFGLNAGRSEAHYDYALAGFIVAPLEPSGVFEFAHAYDLELSGRKLGFHGAWRGRWTRDLVVEVGARWDSYRYPGDLEFSEVSPRFNAVHLLGERGELRASWGVLHQPQGLHELQVEDDLATFFRPERVDQAILGYTHRLDGGISARLDLYRKDYSRLRPRFENALDPVQLIPEGAIDRIRIDAPVAEARGVELTLRREAERGFSGWASVSLAKTEERTLEGWVPRLWEQRHSVSLGLAWTGAKWNINLAGLYHSGAPTTRLRQATVTLPDGDTAEVITAGPRNRERLGPYARVDLRASREVPLRDGRFSYYLEVTNLLNRENPCCKEAYYFVDRGDGRLRLELEESFWLPMLPSFGIRYEF
jgi:hypothetical protein